MTTEAIRSPLTKTAAHPEIRHVAAAEPLAWLRAGWRDFAASPGPSLLYGVGFALACLAVVGLTRELPWFTLAFLTGLLVIGPVLASGLYAAARQMEAGERPSIGAGLRLLYARRTGLALFGVLLALIMAAWVRLSALLFAVKFDAFSPSIEGYLAVIGGAGADPVVAAYFALVGLALAATVFVTSAVARDPRPRRRPVLRHQDQRPGRRAQLARHAAVGGFDRRPDGGGNRQPVPGHGGHFPDPGICHLAQLPGHGALTPSAQDKSPRDGLPR